jgi:predicted DNA-binding transcriptional regulator AlpA
MTQLPTDPSAPRRPQGSSRRLISLAETAQALGMSPASVRRLVWQGQLRTVRITRRLQFDLRDIEALIERSKGSSGL